jgi:hypothetical protein
MGAYGGVNVQTYDGGGTPPPASPYTYQQPQPTTATSTPGGYYVPPPAPTGGTVSPTSGLGATVAGGQPFGPYPGAPPPKGGGTFGYMSLSGMGIDQYVLSEEEQRYAEALGQLSGPALQSYSTFLKQMTSSDPNTRFAAVAPGVEGITSQQEAARRNIQQMPRGGGQEYLTGESYIKQASDVGTLIDQAWLSAEEQQGQFGEWGVAAAQAGLSEEERMLQGAAGTTTAALDFKYGQKAAHDAMVMQALESIAAAAAGGGG